MSRLGTGVPTRGGWDIIDGRANQWLGVLPQVALNHLTQLIEGLSRIAKKT